MIIVTILPTVTNTTENDNIEFSALHSFFNLFTPDGNAQILGTVYIGINDKKIWENLKANITISENKIIEILLNTKVLITILIRVSYLWS